MADYTGWILLGGAALGGLYLYSTGALQGIFSTPSYPQMPQMPMPDTSLFMPQGPNPSAYYENYGQIPGINALMPSPYIIAQAPPEYLLPVPVCGFEPMLYTHPGIWSANKIWEMQYNQLAQTIALRNQLALMRCGMVNFYNTIPWDVDFRNPFLHHIAVSRGVIVDEFHKGTRDSGRANSAALDAASVAHPVTTGHGHGARTSSSAGPSPGQTTPPIPAGGMGSTHPTTSHAFQAVTTPVAGGAAKLAPPPSYDQSIVTPCVTGDC